MNKIAIIGGGPAGLMSAITAKRNNPNLSIIIFEKNDIASTLLPTGGGRCNLSYKENDIKTFAQNYPRGEKFLYSIFNQFFLNDTIKFFNSIGIKTYTQNDKRIFPTTDKSLDVIFALKNEVQRLAIPIKKEEVTKIKKQENVFEINGQIFSKVVVATGGKKSELLNSIQELGIDVLEQKQALGSLEIKEKYFSTISGVSLQNIQATAFLGKKKQTFCEDILFTHKGISGPLAYKTSSIFSRENFDANNPIVLNLCFIKENELNLQNLLDKNPQKEIINLVANFIPKSMTKLLLEQNNIDTNKKCHQINKEERKKITKFLANLELHITNFIKDGEIVSSGGINLNEINSKTMESKKIQGLFFCGEIINVDGFCGGFNLQNCWSTGYVAGISLSK